MKCGFCGSENPSTAKKCSTCGAGLLTPGRPPAIGGGAAGMRTGAGFDLTGQITNSPASTGKYLTLFILASLVHYAVLFGSIPRRVPLLVVFSGSMLVVAFALYKLGDSSKLFRVAIPFLVIESVFLVLVSFSYTEADTGVSYRQRSLFLIILGIVFVTHRVLEFSGAAGISSKPIAHLWRIASVILPLAVAFFLLYNLSTEFAKLIVGDGEGAMYGYWGLLVLFVLAYGVFELFILAIWVKTVSEVKSLANLKNTKTSRF
ncbi:MAG: hypothetical protein K6F11_01930 [Lachnospiraceae bacterium]|nr:hypothetical protein [Lachnospiraceae bacterium]